MTNLLSHRIKNIILTKIKIIKGIIISKLLIIKVIKIYYSQFLYSCHSDKFNLLM